jgi:hypothetical protein
VTGGEKGREEKGHKQGETVCREAGKADVELVVNAVDRKSREKQQMHAGKGWSVVWGNGEATYLVELGGDGLE